MIDRATFVGGSAALVAAQFGGPHPPIVAENDPAIVVVHATLQRPGAAISAYVAMPRTVAATTPGIVLVTHIWGVDAQYRDLTRRFAKLGYIAIAPGLMDRSHVPSGDGMTDSTPFRAAFAEMLTGTFSFGDLLAARAWVRERAPRGKIGIYGNCGGGGLALQALAGTTGYDAAAVLYGFVRADRAATEPPPPSAFAWAARVTTPVTGFYGLLDGSIMVADVETAYGLMRGPHEVFVYPDAAHAFLDDTRASYRPGPAADAWTKLTAWYATYLATA
jgi:carboxymethylenebutenolidase